jgi:hypothetical protein
MISVKGWYRLVVIALVFAILAPTFYTVNTNHGSITKPKPIKIDYSKYRVTENHTYVDVAQKLIEDQVGENYFAEHLYLYSTAFNPTNENWHAQVLYAYKLKIGNHSNLEDVSVWFNNDGTIAWTQGIPPKNMLMPFNVTREEAISIAEKYQPPTNGSLIGAGIRNIATFQILPKYGGYAWVVDYWHMDTMDSSGVSYGTTTDVFIDLYTGTVINSVTSSWIAQP